MNIKKIGIAGAGGIGSNLVQILFDYGFNRKQFDYSAVDIDIYDDDVVDVKNLLHQNFASTDIGKPKVDILANKYVINGINARMNEDDFSKYDLVFSCVDNMPFRKKLYEYGWSKAPHLHWIDGRCTSRQGAIFNNGLAKDMLEKYLSDSIEEGGCLLDYEKENNISHTLPLIIAGMMVQTFLNKIRSQPTFKLVFMV